jgi:hypothetical protein
VFIFHILLVPSIEIIGLVILCDCGAVERNIL